MLQSTAIKKILVMGEGSASVELCLALREEGYQLVLVGADSAGILGEQDLAATFYLGPVSVDSLSQILRKEQPRALLASDSHALKLIQDLAKSSILEDLGVEVLGPNLSVLEQLGNPLLFRNLMEQLGQPVPAYQIIHSVDEGLAFARSTGYPVLVRSGERDSRFSSNEGELRKNLEESFKLSKTPCLLEVVLTGFKEVEYQVLRDRADHALLVSTREYVSPIGTRTNSSLAFSPIQTLSDREHQMLRTASLKIIRALKLEGTCSVRFALNPRNSDYYVLGVNVGLTDSSLLASEYAAYPLAYLTAKLVLGKSLDELENPITSSPALFEPTLDYLLVHFPSFSEGKEGLGVGRTIEESLLKACRALGLHHNELSELTQLSDDALIEKILKPQKDRFFCLSEAIRRGYGIEELSELIKIDLFFLDKLLHIHELEQELAQNPDSIPVLKSAKQFGFSDQKIAEFWNRSAQDIRQLRKEHALLPVYKSMDGSGGEFARKQSCFYATYGWENESQPSGQPSVLILLDEKADLLVSHKIRSLKEEGYEILLLTSSSQAVSILADKVYLEPLTFEEVMNVIDLEQPQEVLLHSSEPAILKLA